LSVDEKLAWQEDTHAREFDEVARYPDFLMRKRYESWNEVRLLRAYLAATPGAKTLFEIGCATGEFSRYVARYLPDLSYRGFDISRPALARAAQKYGPERFVRLEGGLEDFVGRHGSADVVFCRDVVLHQLDPFAFLRRLLAIARGALALRLRTRDEGATSLDAEQSCQFHYDRHWVPYIVLNTQELIGVLSEDPSVRRIVISRRYEVLGGHNFRYLPKDLYRTATKGAETGVLVVKGEGPRSAAPAIEFDDRNDGPRWSLMERTILRLSRRPAPTPPA